MKGRYDEALEVIKKLHGGKPGQDDDFYIREFNQIKGQHELEVRERLGLGAVLRKPSYRKRMFIVVFQVGSSFPIASGCQRQSAAPCFPQF
jgi:hypothetical protein